MDTHHGHHHTPQEWADRLHDAHLRATPQRLAVLDYLHDHPHIDAEHIFQGVRAHLPTISLQAIHLIVKDLTEKALIRRTNIGSTNSAKYETRIGDNHHHIQCLECGRVEDVDCETGCAPCLAPVHTHGMRVIEASIVFHGICQQCDINKGEKTP